MFAGSLMDTHGAASSVQSGQRQGTDQVGSFLQFRVLTTEDAVRQRSRIIVYFVTLMLPKCLYTPTTSMRCAPDLIINMSLSARRRQTGLVALRALVSP